MEDAADSMIYLRDYVDCVDCLTLPEFSDVELRKGFSPVIQEKALEKFKIHSVSYLFVFTLPVFVF